MKKIYNGLSGINTCLQKAEKFLGCVSLGILLIVMLINAALRYFLSSGLNFSDELNGFLFVWFGFLSASYAMSTESHLNITALTNLFPEIVQYFLKMIMDVIMLGSFVFYMPSLFKLLKTLPISNVMRLPLKYVYLILPVAFGVMCFHIIFNMIQDTFQFFGKKGDSK